jgi:hypothetical protein
MIHEHWTLISNIELRRECSLVSNIQLQGFRFKSDEIVQFNNIDVISWVTWIKYLTKNILTQEIPYI